MGSTLTKPEEPTKLEIFICYVILLGLLCLILYPPLKWIENVSKEHKAEQLAKIEKTSIPSEFHQQVLALQDKIVFSENIEASSGSELASKVSEQITKTNNDMTSFGYLSISADVITINETTAIVTFTYVSKESEDYKNKNGYYYYHDYNRNIGSNPHRGF